MGLSSRHSPVSSGGPVMPQAYASHQRWFLFCERCGNTLGVWEFPSDWSAAIAVPSSRRHSGCSGSLAIHRLFTPLRNIAITNPALLSILRALGYPNLDASGNRLVDDGAVGSEILSTST